MIQLPQIDLNAIVPVAGLAVIAVACIVALLLRSVLRSRIILPIALVVGVALAGPALLLTMTSLIWALVPLALVVIVGTVAVLWVMGRHPELITLAREMIPPRTPPQPLLPDGQENTIVIDQPPATTHRTAIPQRLATRTTIVNPDVDRWGF